jgi:hypothetical protein
LSSALFSLDDAAVLTIKIEKALESSPGVVGEVVFPGEQSAFHAGDRLDYDRLVEVLDEGRPVLVF